MEGEEIGLVLARASELRAKVSDCIDGSGGDACGLIAVEDESEGLVAIRNALDSLEQQLAALQALLHQQRYERESILSQIDCNRLILLGKLKEYRGEKLEVINEVAAFASEAVEHDDGLFLPPYPTHLPDLFTLDDIGGSSHFVVKKSSINGHITINKNEDKTTEYDTHKNCRKATSNGIGHIIGLVVKSAITFVSIISILGLAGYKPMIKKRSKGIMLSGAESPMDSQVGIQCPKGKFLVIENGKARCVVKERIEVPFEPDVTSPTISYGFG
ncbi:plastid division protein PDV2-like [Zingiber officinale]|uniref:plastid division protein PDV2-like n=1 Tax=Zingiber officinale TaxID=94328 RepID=UPI001C4CA105|nr:plastid division protein PDV2-like [Zingiber officinale]